MVGAFLKCMFIYLTSQQLTVEGTDIVWQMCLGRCVHLGLTNASFADQSHYCKSINAKQVHFGHNEEQALATKLLACRLQKLDGESYWIRRQNIQNHNKPICHTMTFSGNTVHFSQNTPCSSLSHPFCETDKSSCQISRSIKGTVDWVKVAGQSSLYKLSSSAYPYCEAKTFCQKDRHGKIASVGNYSFMGLLAAKLGISGTMKLDVWLDSPVKLRAVTRTIGPVTKIRHIESYMIGSCITCPSRPSRLDVGSIMRYTGPLIHLIESSNADVNFKVLCETNTTTKPTATSDPSNTQSVISSTLSSLKAAPVSVTSGGSDWQLCFDKCYYLTSKIKVTFEDQKAVCQSMGSRPVDFGSKQEQTLAAELSTYRLVKFDGQPYWINKRNTVNNSGIPSCRTITFSGNGIHLEQDVSCSALSHPFCENDISFCQSSRKNNTLTHDWVKVGQSNYYHLSYSTHTYCDAKTFCQKVLHGKIASVGNYSFMGLLAIKLGISGTTKLDVWLDSSGNSCPSGSGLGNVMRYTGPLVHLIEMRNTSENFRVLCETNTITNSTQITSSLQTTITTRTTKPIRHSTTHLATVKSSTSTRIPQTYTVSPSTQSGVPQTTQYQSSSTTRLQSALVSRQATSAKRPQSISTTPQQLASTITQQEASATLKQSTTTTLLQSASTADHQATSTTQAQPQVESSTRIQTTSTTGLQAVSITRIQAASTTKSSAASTTSQHATKPAAMSSVPRHREAKKLAVSRTSDPEWLKVSLNEYFINYKSSTYRQSGHISTNYFKILPNSNADSFWIGAHTVRDEEPSDTGITYIPYKNEPVRFSLTKEQVQGMWKELRQQRNANKNAKSP